MAKPSSLDVRLMGRKVAERFAAIAPETDEAPKCSECGDSISSDQSSIEYEGREYHAECARWA